MKSKVLPQFNVLNYNFNAQKLEPYNIINDGLIEEFKKIKKKTSSVEEQKKELDHYFLWRYWSKREYEIFVGDAFEEDLKKYEKVDVYKQIKMNFDLIFNIVKDL